MIVNPVSVDMVVNFYFNGDVIVIFVIKGVAPVIEGGAVNGVFLFVYVVLFQGFEDIVIGVSRMLEFFLGVWEGVIDGLLYFFVYAWDVFVN